MAHERGYPTGRYWWAFGGILAATTALYVGLLVALFVVAAHSANSYSVQVPAGVGAYSSPTAGTSTPSGGDPAIGTADSTTTTTSPSPPAGQVVSSVAADLSRSAQVRSGVQAAINGVQSCNESPSAGQASLASIIATRQSVLQDLGSLDASQLPGGAQMVSDLQQAMNDSVQADQDFSAWMADIAAGSAQCGTDPTVDSSYQNGLAASTQATADKTTFVNEWNPVAAQYNQQTYQPGDF
ncbi:hypothetical protein K6U06_14615 [Acidiferrimicrobium sp. IK]|uniref:hypothetical protein n=1 Tax=Acidiferrimicrobium sp. IK TaxID=2871700 RepID=UPI0021CB4069|nr:hypothetical protein [Acidiferrimicrobium sp. IK]MCU4185598.1 hypothetical protein [Acidiferrimicrobium sp. IK]